jgi:hypothetical protein
MSCTLQVTEVVGADLAAVVVVAEVLEVVVMIKDHLHQ